MKRPPGTPASGPPRRGDPRTALTEDERSELTWLRNENALLRVERDILMCVAAGYAKDTGSPVNGRTPRFGP